MNDLLDTKDKEIKSFEELIRQKDDLIRYLESQLKRYTKEKNEELQKVMKEQQALKNQNLDPGDNQEQAIAQEFFIRLAHFLFKKKLTLYQVIHSKIFDKMINGNEVELISVDHFWRLLQKVGFKVITSEKNAVNTMIKNPVLHEIIEVKGLRRILSQLGIVEDVPQNTKNFNYDDLSGIGIRVINKIVREMKNKKITDITEFLGKENIEDKQLVAGKKTEVVEIISAESFLKVLRQKAILRRWEDLDENLQIFLSLPSASSISKNSLSGDQLMIRKIKKCVQDFQNCEFFEYYGVEPRSESEVYSDHEEEEFNEMDKVRQRLTTIK